MKHSPWHKMFRIIRTILEEDKQEHEVKRKLFENKTILKRMAREYKNLSHVSHCLFQETWSTDVMKTWRLMRSCDSTSILLFHVWESLPPMLLGPGLCLCYLNTVHLISETNSLLTVRLSCLWCCMLCHCNPCPSQCLLSCFRRCDTIHIIQLESKNATSKHFSMAPFLKSPAKLRTPRFMLSWKSERLPHIWHISPGLILDNEEITEEPRLSPRSLWLPCSCVFNSTSLKRLERETRWNCTLNLCYQPLPLFPANSTPP